MTPNIKKLIFVRQAAFVVGDSNKWETLRYKVKREIVTAKTNYYAERVRHLQKHDSKKWHQPIKIMTRNDSAELSIQVPGVCTSNHNDIANTINDQFVNVSSGLTPLDISKLPVFLPAPKPPSYLYPWEVYNVLKSLNHLKPLVLMEYRLDLSNNLPMS